MHIEQNTHCIPVFEVLAYHKMRSQCSKFTLKFAFRISRLTQLTLQHSCCTGEVQWNGWTLDPRNFGISDFKRTSLRPFDFYFEALFDTVTAKIKLLVGGGGHTIHGTSNTIQLSLFGEALAIRVSNFFLYNLKGNISSLTRHWAAKVMLATANTKMRVLHQLQAPQMK